MWKSIITPPFPLFDTCGRNIDVMCVRNQADLLWSIIFYIVLRRDSIIEYILQLSKPCIPSSYEIADIIVALLYKCIALIAGKTLDGETVIYCVVIVHSLWHFLQSVIIGSASSQHHKTLTAGVYIFFLGWGGLGGGGNNTICHTPDQTITARHGNIQKPCTRVTSPFIPPLLPSTWGFASCVDSGWHAAQASL